jgi:hypothetical protein
MLRLERPLSTLSGHSVWCWKPDVVSPLRCCHKTGDYGKFTLFRSVAWGERSSTELGPLESGPRVWVVVVFYSVPTDGRGTEWFCNRRDHSPIKRIRARACSAS